MPIFELTSLLVLGALTWLWFDSLRARDLCIATAKSLCATEGLQLLDDTVAIASMKPVRGDGGQLVLRRVYGFEYSDTGDNRRQGSVVMQGHQVLLVNLGQRDDSTSDGPPRAPI